MHPRVRRALQRALARWDAARHIALEIRSGDPLARRLGALGPGSLIEHPCTMLGNSSAVVIGAGTTIRSGFVFEALAPVGATVIRIGDGCYLGRGVRMVAVNGIALGDHAAIGHGCTLADTVHDYKSAEGDETWQAGLKVGKVLRIEANAWIGNNTVVAGGITVGAGAIVNANSVISRDVPPNTLVGGNPAEVWRQRDDSGSWRWVIDPETLELDAEAAARADVGPER